MPTRHAVVLLPGIVLPAAPAYEALLEVLGERVDAVAKELEVYSGEQPQESYSLDARSRGSCGRLTRTDSTGSISSAT